jgi:hypothetical protein
MSVILCEDGVMADFIRFKDADREIMRRVRVDAVAEYSTPPADKEVTRVILVNGGSVYTRHTPEEIDRAIESEGRIVSV